MSAVIVDYGAGNLRSVTKAVEHTGHRPLVTSRAADIERAEAIILPGVGAAADTMRNLHAAGLATPLKEYIAGGRPFLGICMGLQVLATVSEEGGRHACLDVIPGTVRRLVGGEGLKVPHMGWNNVRQRRPHYLFRDIPDGAYFYFVHSYYVDPDDDAVTLADADYGQRFVAAAERGSLVATQFHPEKSGTLGLRIYANFLQHALGEAAN